MIGPYYGLGISKAYCRHFSHLSQEYLKDILGISQPYLVHIFGINKACLRNIPYFSGISQILIEHILSKASFEHLSDIP